MPKASVTVSTIQTNRFVRSAHRSVPAATAMRIRAPPIVGVPIFPRCEPGPSSRTTWPIWRAASIRIIEGPTNSAIVSAVSAANMARSVRYPKTRNPP